jgi:hypothetical protein
MTVKEIISLPRSDALLFVLVTSLIAHGVALADTVDISTKGIPGGPFEYRLEGLAFGSDRGLVKDSPINHGNVLNIPETSFSGEARVDLGWNYDRIYFGIKPRVYSGWQPRGLFPINGREHSGTELYVQEWLLRYRLSDAISASYGRQNLQWGPSFLTSPSNPFFQNNGQSNPYLEVPGLDYAQATWVLSSTWSGQLIANVGEGRLDLPKPFHNTYAAKVDFLGVGRFGSLIVSQREDGPTTLGGYFGYTINDGLLAHAEGSVNGDGVGQLLVGGSYTFSDGSTVALEYFYNGYGCTSLALESCIKQTSVEESRNTLLGSNYVFAQYFKNEFFIPSLDFVIRGTADTDDGSGVVTSIANYDLSKHAELFAVWDLYSGGPNDYFGSILHYSIMGGLRVTY